MSDFAKMVRELRSDNKKLMLVRYESDRTGKSVHVARGIFKDSPGAPPRVMRGTVRDLAGSFD